MSLAKKIHYHFSSLDPGAFVRNLCYFSRLPQNLVFLKRRTRFPEVCLCDAGGVTLKQVYFKNKPVGLWDYFFFITIDMERFHLDVRVNNRPLSTREWVSRTVPLILVNGGFFDHDYKPVGLAGGGGLLAGALESHLRGILLLKKQSITIDWAKNRTGEDLGEYDAVLQSGPLIIEPGGGRGIICDDRKRDSRTVVGIDAEGKLVFAVFPNRSVSLFEVMEILIPHNLKACMNLDGGTSVSLYFSNNGTMLYLPSIKKIPDVIAISMKKETCWNP
jgi:hypothetical protein